MTNFKLFISNNTTSDSLMTLCTTWKRSYEVFCFFLWNANTYYNAVKESTTTLCAEPADARVMIWGFHCTVLLIGSLYQKVTASSWTQSLLFAYRRFDMYFRAPSLLALVHTRSSNSLLNITYIVNRRKTEDRNVWQLRVQRKWFSRENK